MKWFSATIVFLIFCSSASSLANENCENAYARLDADFDGARMSSCKARRKSFLIDIEPENKPINPSPWYAFKVTPKRDEEVEVVIRYDGARHRYRPKVSSDAKAWRLLPDDRVREHRKGRKVKLKLESASEPFFVAAQELILEPHYTAARTSLAAAPGVSSVEIGRSVEDRPLFALTSEPEEKRVDKEYVLLVGRQHPPEVTGALAMFSFLERVFGAGDLAEKFRRRFHIIAVPLMNPDGVARGNWRHNVNGVDLNRDWGPFSQPETQALKRVLDKIDAEENAELVLILDFHSTNRNVFYTQTSTDVTDPPNFAERWLARARESGDLYEFEHAERPVSDLPTSKQYVFKRFGVPAITYELGDRTDRDAITSSSHVFADTMMETLMNESTE